MNMVDATFVRLAEPASRAALFDQDSLEQLVSAAYDTTTTGAAGPYSPVFEEFRLGLFPPRLGTLVGAWNAVGQPDRTEARFDLTNVGAGLDTVPRIDGFWRGAIVTTTAPLSGQITNASGTWPRLTGIDDEIRAALGALPSDSATLEAERRARVITRLRAGLAQPEALSNATFDRWLHEIGAKSAGDLIEHFDVVVHAGTFRVKFSMIDGALPSPRPLPVAVALLIRDTGFSVAQLVSESRLVRERLDMLGLERPRDASFRIKEPLLVAWVVPVSIFDDQDWGPSGAATAELQRQERRRSAGRWLAREGIGLVAVA
jgi:hypothetical protein